MSFLRSTTRSAERGAVATVAERRTFTAFATETTTVTAVSAKKQRELAQAIKRARFLGLLPYVIS